MTRPVDSGPNPNVSDMNVTDMLRGFAVTACLLLAGCLTDGTDRAARVNEVHACAIGYDLAREIHRRVSLRRVVIISPQRPNACTRHALDYLRRGGFRIDHTGQGGVTFTVELMGIDADTVSAIASIGADLRIARTYRPIQTGVIAEGPVSVQHLNPDTYAPRERAPHGDTS